MIGVYENAARVVVWLGPQIDTTAIAVAQLKQLQRDRQNAITATTRTRFASLVH